MIGRFAKLGVYRQLLRSWDFLRLLVSGLLALSGYLWDSSSPSPSTTGQLLALGAVALNGVPIIWGAVTGLMRRKVNVDELVSLAIIACLIEGEFLTAAVVSFVMVLGALIEEATADSARKAIETLMTLSPEEATLLTDEGEKTVPIAEVKPGDQLLVKPGDRIPVDGVIRQGITAVDESSMTGEPIPREAATGDTVYAGTLNQTGVIEIEATRVGEETALGKVVKLVSDAEQHKPDATRLIDRYARWFTPTIILCAAVAWVITGEANRAVTVLIVGCPCALILAAPTAVVATIGRAARSGILVKGGLFLEVVGRADVILFDKTGTLTEGKPRVDAIETAQDVTRDELLSRAASVEQNSTHPLARAVLSAAEDEGLELAAAEEMFTEIGLGVRARVEGELIEVGSAYIGGGTMSVPEPLRRHLERIKERGATPLVVYRDGEPLGILGVADHVRPGARDTVEKLRSFGFDRIGILTGDHEKSAQLVADAVCLDDVWAELKPGDKLRLIEGLQESGSVVMFVGDGINDAPALAAADVGIAMGAAGSDVALETADVALMHDDIAKLPFLVKLGRRMLRVIKLNIIFALLFNAAAVIACGGGYLTPIMGAVAHNIGSVLVVLFSASMVFTSERD